MPTLDVVLYSVVMTLSIGAGFLGGLFAGFWGGYSDWKDVTAGIWGGLLLGLMNCAVLWCILWGLRAVL